MGFGAHAVVAVVLANLPGAGVRGSSAARGTTLVVRSSPARRPGAAVLSLLLAAPAQCRSTRASSGRVRLTKWTVAPARAAPFPGGPSRAKPTNGGGPAWVVRRAGRACTSAVAAILRAARRTVAVLGNCRRRGARGWHNASWRSAPHWRLARRDCAPLTKAALMRGRLRGQAGRLPRAWRGSGRAANHSVTLLSGG